MFLVNVVFDAVPADATGDVTAPNPRQLSRSGARFMRSSLSDEQASPQGARHYIRRFGSVNRYHGEGR